MGDGNDVLIKKRLWLNYISQIVIWSLDELRWSKLLQNREHVSMPFHITCNVINLVTKEFSPYREYREEKKTTEKKRVLTMVDRF